MDSNDSEKIRILQHSSRSTRSTSQKIKFHEKSQLNFQFQVPQWVQVLDRHLATPSELAKIRSRLHRRRSFRFETLWKALDEISTMHFMKIKISWKSQLNFQFQVPQWVRSSNEQNHFNTVRGSFFSVWRATRARVVAFCSIFRDLGNALFKN